MNKILLTFYGGLLVAASLGAQSQPPAPSAPPPSNGNRFLFVVDTSAGMRRLDYGNRQTLFDLIFSGVEHQMRAQDTFGLWTFNNKVSAGEYPMQVWEAEKSLELASRATFFLKGKRYTGKCEMEAAMFSIASLLHRVKDVNIFILSDGATPVRGTPFDEPINLAYKQKAGDQRKVGKPFITTLIVRGGSITSARVTLPGEPLELPAPPAIAKVTPPAPAPPRPTAQPIIMKSAAATQAASPVPALPKETLSIPGKGSASKSVPLANPDLASAESTAGLPSESGSHEEPSEKMRPAASPAPFAQTAPAKGEPESAAKVTPTAASPNPISPDLGQEKTKVTPTPATLEAPAPEPAKASAREPASDASTPSIALPKLLPQPLAVAAREPSANPKQAQPAATASQANSALTPMPLFSPQILVLCGSVLLAGALCLLILIFRRLHKIPEPSIITRSMEQRS